MAEIIQNQQKKMVEISDQVLQAAQNERFIHTGHFTLDLNMCKVRYEFNCDNPVFMAHLYGN